MDVSVQPHVMPCVAWKVWVLTGDKKETAISISLTCGHTSSDMKMLEVSQTTVVVGMQCLTRGHSHQLPMDVFPWYTLHAIRKYAYHETMAVFRPHTPLHCDCAALLAVVSQFPQLYVIRVQEPVVCTHSACILISLRCLGADCRSCQLSVMRSCDRRHVGHGARR